MGIVYDEGDFRAKQIDFDVPVDTLDDDEIVDTIVALTTEAADIARQLEDHRMGVDVREDVWTKRAATARRFRLRQIDKLTAEAIRRGLEIPTQQAAERSQRLREESQRRQIRAENAAKNTEEFLAAERRRQDKAERHKQVTLKEVARIETKAGLFHAAAVACMTKADRQKVWVKAEEMFPDHPIFQNREKA